jgi:hypothetical protein
MAYGEHRMAYGEHRMAYGEHRMAYGEHRMAYGEHRMAYGEHEWQMVSTAILNRVTNVLPCFMHVSHASLPTHSS